jgi:hypothetical protein
VGIGYNEGTFRLSNIDELILIQRQGVCSFPCLSQPHPLTFMMSAPTIAVIYDATYYAVSGGAWSQAADMDMFDWGNPFDVQRFELSIAGQLAFGIGDFIYQTPGGRFVPSPAVAAVLSPWSAWFKQYRTLLSAGDVIHVSRPDGQGVDVIVRARATDPTCVGLVFLTNPTSDAITLSTLLLPLYYTGAQPGGSARLLWNGTGQPIELQLDWRARGLLYNVTVASRSVAWATVELA